MRLFLIMTVVLATVGWVTPAKALECVQALTAQEDFSAAAAVFSGRATAADLSPNQNPTQKNRFTFAVDKVYKGDLPARLTLETDGQWGMTFVVGQDYLVYLDSTNPYAIHLCTYGARLLAQAGSHLDQMRQAGITPVAPAPAPEIPVDVAYTPWEWVIAIVLLVGGYLALRHFNPRPKA